MPSTLSSADVSPRRVERVVLTGFMGSGKTTVGRLLADRLGWAFADLDEEITQDSGLSVPEIFSRWGEPRFRELESLALARVLTRSRLVLALGGGAPEADANRTLLLSSPDTLVVYLAGEFEVLHARCLGQAQEAGAIARPVLTDLEAAQARFRKRVPFYEDVASLTHATAGRSPTQLAESIAETLGPALAAEAGRETP